MNGVKKLINFQKEMEEAKLDVCGRSETHLIGGTYGVVMSNGV